MKKTLFLVFIFVLSLNYSYCQTEEDDSTAFNREKWFYVPRSSPDNFIPPEALYNAYQEKNAMGPNYYIINNNWSNIGPAPVIDGLGYPVSGRINTVKYYDDHTVYIGAAQGGVWMAQYYYTTGTDWINKSSDLISLSSGALAIDKISDPPIIYYGTGEGNYGFIYSYLGMGIFKSTNNGNNWFQTNSQNSNLPKDLRIFRITIRPGSNNNNQVFAATNKGLFRSDDFGDSWQIIDGTSNRHCNDIVFSEQNNNIAYACGPSRDLPAYDIQGIGFLKSTDGGVTWNELVPTVPTYDFPVRRSHIDLSKVDDSYLYAVTNDNGWITAFVSTDGGNSFVGKRIQNNGVQSDYNIFIKVKPGDPSTAFVGGVDLYRTLNYGADYCSITMGNSCFPTGSSMHKDFHNMDFNPDVENYPNEMIVACDGGAYLSTNNGTDWYSMNYDPDFSITQVYRVSSGNFLLGGLQDHGIYFKNSTNNGWTYLHVGGDGTFVLNSKHLPGQMWGITGNDGTVYNNCVTPIESSNFGNKWDGGNDWIGALAEHPINAGYLYHARRNETQGNVRVFFSKSTDYGTSWFNGIPMSIINSSYSPQNIEFSKSNPDIIYLSTSGYIGEWNNPIFGRELYKSTDGGENWLTALISISDITVPKRYITKVLSNFSENLQNEDDVYITLSGLNGQGGGNGHVFKSTNGGYNWIDISGNLPDVPVNDIEIWESGCNQKTIIIATDVGVFGSIDNGNTWKTFAPQLPNSVALDLEFLPFEHKLKVATFGRGVWEVDFSNLPIYVKGYHELNRGITALDDIIICNNSYLKFTQNVNITMWGQGKKIIVEDGGRLDIEHGGNIAGPGNQNWSGIEFRGSSYGNILNCNFYATNTPITITGNGDNVYNQINIENCSFNNYQSGPIQISSRPNVKVNDCNWFLNNESYQEGIISIGSDNIILTNNTINGSPTASSTGISVIYGSGIVVQKNEINNMAVGISVSNSSPLVSQNRITNSSSALAVVGMGFDNSYSAAVKQNTVIGYQIGYKLYNSSPEMYFDSSYNTGTSGDSVNGLHAVYLSNPRLKPTESGRITIWDAGKNNIKTINKGSGIYMYISSVPILDYGYNHIWGYDNYLFGDGPEVSEYYARCNIWVDDPPNAGEFNLSAPGSVIYSPYGCTPPGGSGSSSVMVVNDPIEDIEDSENPPSFIVVNYGHGIYDTIKLTTGTVDPPADQNAFGEAVNEELNGNYSTAVTKYKNLLSNYQTSILARNTLKKILNCYVKMNADSNQYSELRNYYLSLIQQNPSDTAFVKAAKELAAKTLVKKGEFSNAITEYESLISGNSVMHDVLCYELNIIETYMIMSESGDSPGFTGNIASLKPVNKKDGYRKIMEKLYGVKSTQNNPVIPVKFSLSQNYPNPFNPVTKINYSLPRAVKVNINVYDIIGRLVKTLVNEFKEAGSYDIQFNGGGLASGVYFYRIEAGDFVDSKKMVLVK